MSTQPTEMMPTARERSFAYRSLMTSQEQVDVVEPVRDQLATWLRHKKQWDVDTTVAGTHRDAERTLDIVYHQPTRGLRARLTEDHPATGTWQTELLASQDRDGGGWVALSVANDRGNFVDVPVLARYLMQALPLGDASLEFMDRAQIFYEHDVDRLIDVLCDEERQGIVFVAGTGTEGIDFATFARKVDDWTKQVLGLAQVIVLDPGATSRLESEWGHRHATPAWTIRTYFPGVDPASEQDARRHRILGTPSLANLRDARVRRLLGGVARLQGSHRREPPAVIRLRRVFERLDNQAIVAAIETQRPTPSEEASAAAPSAVTADRDPVGATTIGEDAERYLAQVQLVKDVLGLSVLDESALRQVAERAIAPAPDTAAITRASEQIVNQRERIEELEDRLADVSQSLDDDHLEKAIVQLDLDDAQARIRFLQRSLVEAKEFESAYAEVPLDQRIEYPESFDELLDRLDSIRPKAVAFTGDPRVTVALTEQDTQGMAVRMAWDAVLALCEYARARREGSSTSGFQHYLDHTPAGYLAFPPGKHSAGETGATKRQFGDERRLPVPEIVDPTGAATMVAHFRLARIGMVSPRMYYLDHLAKSDAIYIGYIGPHLTNTQTN